MEKEKLRNQLEYCWKKQPLNKDQFKGQNSLLKDQSEYNYIINFVSEIYQGETTLKSSAILKNESLHDDLHRNHGNKIDLIFSIAELQLELSVLEVSGSPTNSDHSHYIGDRNKLAKMLKIILNYIIKKHPGHFEIIRKVRLYGIQIYNKDFQICGFD
nr:5054_t:CDS:2 [Entrophospora candida]CAG8604627.1 7200_t:CDS:2 [Entrophospora candida]